MDANATPNLATPAGLWLLAALAPLVLLYVLRAKRTAKRVPSTFLWAAAGRDLAAQHPWQRLVAQVPLVLETLAIIALALALARPRGCGHQVTAQHVAIVVDTSASMGALEGAKPGAAAQPTRLDLAKRRAHAILDALRPDADVLVVEAEREARVVTPFERDLHRAAAAIDKLETREVEGDLTPAVGLAADRLRAAGGEGELYLVTDGALAHEPPHEVAGVTVRVVQVGESAPNAAIVRVDARLGVRPGRDAAPREDRNEVQVFAMLRNLGSVARDSYVTAALLTDEGPSAPLASRRVLLPPDDEAPVVLTFDAPRLATTNPLGARPPLGIVVQLSPGDALPSDDVAYARLPPPRRTPVVLAGPSPWLERALGADPDVALQRLTRDEVTTVNVDADALVVVDGACPASLPGADVLVVNPPVGPCFGVDVGAEVTSPRITSWETGDARFRFLTLDGLHLARARALTPPPRAALVRAGEVAVMAEGANGRAATVVGFDLAASDWPLQASFVLFVRNVVEQSREHRRAGEHGAARTGDALRITPPPGVDSVSLRARDASEAARGPLELPVRAGLVLVPPPSHAGLYEARWTSPHVGSVVVPVNLASARESDLRPHPLSLGRAAGVATGTSVLPPRERAAWLALAGALLVALDLLWLARGGRGRRAPPPTSEVATVSEAAPR